MSVGHDQTSQVPERAQPAEMSGHLMESEHRGRYTWVSALVGGLDAVDAGCGTGYGAEILAEAGAQRVVGIDISESAIEYAQSNSTHSSAEFILGTVHELPFADGSFDLAVCFEVIEHLEDQPLAIGELRRVLRTDGVLAISSPNRNVYPPGNPHHTHEYVPRELEQALSEHFANVRLYRQSPWLASAILDDEQSLAVGAEAELLMRVIKIASVGPGEELFTVALASNGELPTPEALALMGEPFEVRWWQEQLSAARESEQRLGAWASNREAALQATTREAASLHEQLLAAAREAATLREKTTSAHEREAGSARRVLEVEEVLAGAQARVAALDEAYTSHCAQIAVLEERLERADRVLAAMQTSLSWRVTAPLRLLKRRR